MSKSSVARRLSAILVADAVDYTAHMQRDENSTYRRVRSDLDNIFTPLIEAHGGRVVKTMGDGVLAEFPSAVDCVTCALEAQSALDERPSDGSAPPPLAYRMAVNVGDLISENGDVFGDGVNLAMRLQAVAEPGSIVIPGDAYRQVRGRVEARFEDLGEQEIKGVKEPVRVHRILASSPSAVAAGRPLPAAPSIAVLPFDNLGGDPAQSYFSDGITNDIITDLSKFSELFVIASHSVFAYKGKAARIEDVSRELGVRYVVEGSIQRAGDRLRINVQLIEGARGHHIWAERYDRPTEEIFRLQDEIVQTIVGTLVARLHLSERERVLKSKPDSLQAYDAYLRGRAVWATWTEESNREAQAWFRRAIALDQNFALAYGYLSYTYVQAWLGGWEQSPETLARARELAQKAVDLGPTDFDNHWSLAAAYLHSREFEKAMAAYERAADLNANSPNLLVDMAEALVYVGRTDEAIANISRAMRLNPIYPDWYLWTLGIALYHAGRHRDAAAAVTKMGNMPNLARRVLIASYVRLDRMEEARRIAAEFLRHDPSYTLKREAVWPYQAPALQSAFLADLKSAGLPDTETPGTQGGRSR
jgi:TolB-like protein/class 3 adenylate cyclase